MGSQPSREIKETQHLRESVFCAIVPKQELPDFLKCWSTVNVQQGALETTVLTGALAGEPWWWTWMNDY
jgi:hypothetical protein